MPFHPTETPPSPFHPGERDMQARAGVRERMDQRAARAIRDAMPEQHRAFFAGLALLPLAVNDRRGWPAATLLTGAPGFVASPDPRRLRIALPAERAAPPDSTLVPGTPVGLLGITFATRRRNRLNGLVARIDAGGFDVAVVQSFGNCAQYIQARDIQAPGIPAHDSGAGDSGAGDIRAGDAGAGAAGTADGGAAWLPALDVPARRLIAGADTMFVASAEQADAAGAVDVSHRGGRPGFLRLDGDVLTVPDFAGNRYFNTLGNFRLNPRAALLLPDFATGALLHLSGAVELVEQGAEIAAFRGAERLWRVHIAAAWRRTDVLPRGWSPPEPAPTTLATGSWAGVSGPPSAPPPPGPPPVPSPY